MRSCNFSTRHVILILVFLFITGCSGGGTDPVIPPEPQDMPFEQAGETVIDESPDAGRVLWGFWEISFDPDKMAMEIELLRNVQTHFNITDFILPPVCDDCFAININGFDTVTRILDADVTLRNPMAINGRDVRGILFTNQYGHLVMNSDGWTERWDIPNGEDFNPFRAFAKEETNRVFAGGTEHTENYLIYIPLPPNFWAIQFAVDASYPGNCKEPYQIGDLYGSDIMYDYQGCEASYQLDLFDWQDDIDSVIINAVEVTSDESTPFTHVSGNEWSVDLCNEENAPAGDYRFLVRATSANSTIPLYQYVNLTVAESPPPTVTSIDPDFGYGGDEDVDVTVLGTNFFGSTASVVLRRLGEPAIAAENVLVISTTEISCNLSLPDYAAIGLYNVEVTNGCGKSGVGMEMFEIGQPIFDTPLEITPPWLRFSPLAVCVSGDYAYVASGVNGFHIFDITDPTNISWLTKTQYNGWAADVAINGDYVFVADADAGLHCFNVSTPSSPEYVGTCDIEGGLTSVTLVGDYAYCGDDSGYLHIIYTPTASLEKTVYLGDDYEVHGIAISNGYAYVAHEYAGVKIVDIDPISSAYVVNAISLSGYVGDVYVEGDLAYICNTDEGFVIQNISNPLDIVHVKTVTGTTPNALVVSGGYVYTSEGDGPSPGMDIIDIDPPGDAYVADSVVIVGWTKDIAVSDGYAYLVDINAGLKVMDIDPVGSTAMVSRFDVPVNACYVGVDNGHAFVANEYPGLMVVDATSPGDASVIKTFDDVYGTALDIEDGYCYLTDWGNMLSIIDIDPIGSADVVNSLILPQYPQGVKVQGDYAYVASTWGGGFNIVDINPPESAYIVKTIVLTNDVIEVDYANGYAYVTGEDGLHIFDVSIPETAYLAKTVATTVFCEGIYVQDGYAYVGSEDALYIIDVDPPVSASIVKSVPLPAHGIDVTVASGYAFVATFEEGVQVIDVYPINEATNLFTIEAVCEAYNVKVVGNIAYIADYGLGLRMYELW